MLKRDVDFYQNISYNKEKMMLKVPILGE